MKSTADPMSDFWWLPENADIKDLLMVVGHHRPLTDEDDPSETEWFYSVNSQGKVSPEMNKFDFNFISQWRNVCNDTNVYRTLKVFDRNTGEALLLGPFLMDIDSSGYETNYKGYKENLSDALITTRNVAEHLIKDMGITLKDMRIFFSGRKGFNIEVHPQTLGIKGSVSKQIELSYKKQDEIIKAVEVINTDDVAHTQLDKVYGNRFGYTLKHPYVRLHGSINKWISGDGKAIARRKIEITYNQLCANSATEISSESERKAQLL